MAGTNDQIILSQVLEQKRAELAPELPEDEFFEVFVAEQVLKEFDLSYEELDVGIVGSGGDGGIDAFYVFANGEFVQEDFDYSPLKKGASIEVVVIQAKRTAGFGESAIDKLSSACEDLLNLSKDINELSAVYNEELRTAVGSLRRLYEGLASRFPRLRFRFVYASKGLEVHPNVQRKAELLSDKIRALFSAAEVSFEFAGAPRLLELARRTPRTSYALSLAEIPISTSGDVGFICLVKLRDYFTFLSGENGQLRKALFEANVRDYQGATQVNEEIQGSLRKRTREDFWWLNNGITIVASQATQGGKALTLEDPQIVNGLQTSTEIWNYFRSSNSEGDDRNLLVRVIVPPEIDSRDRIIKATNSQTYIPPASLRATDKIQRDIEEYLKPFGLYYDRRKNFYKNDGKAIENIVSISLMAQAVMSIVLQRPDAARARPSSLLKSDSDYDGLFDPEYPIEIYRLCIAILRRVESACRVEGILVRDRNNLRFYAAMHVAAMCSGQVHPSVKSLCQLKIEAFTIKLITASLEAVVEAYRDLGANDQAAKGPLLLQLVEGDLHHRLASR